MLANKVAQLKQGATAALTTAEWWEKQIATHGEAKAEAFYTQKLGLNHLHKSTVEWEGLTLSREPTEAEKLCIKSISQAQDAGKASVTKILLQVRSALIDDALKAIKKLAPATYHELILTVPDKLKSELRDQIDAVFMKGKRLVTAEMDAQSGKASLEGYVSKAESLGLEFPEFKQADPTDDEDSELDDLSDLTGSRVANDVQSRITSAAARFALLGLTGAALWKAVREEINTGSISYIDRASQGLANRVLNMGRSSEMFDRRDEIGEYEYSAILDQNTCGPCAQDDGQTASSPNDLPDTPNPECEGSDFCRCFIVAILDTVA